jgi:polyhydroxyalkanoate synthase
LSGGSSGGGGGPGADWAERARRGIRLAGTLAEAAGAGPEIATAPKREIWRDGGVTLHRYQPETPDPPLGPLLILQGLVGRQTITDLEPGRSLVRRLLAGGADLYVIDWGSPTRAEMCLDMTDYAEFWLGDALAAVRAESGRARAALLGICQGGVFALCHAARHPERVAGLATMVTPVDFYADRADPDPAHGILNVWARSLEPELVAAAIDERGLVPGAVTGAVFQMLTPARTAAKYSTELADLADDGAALATFLRMERWLADRPDHPGAAAKEWLIELYHRNRLVEGSFEIAGEPVDLGRVACPVLNIYARDDHIVPAPCAAALAGLTASPDYRALEVPTGHIGVFVSRTAQEIVPPAILDWLGRLDTGG